jgi:sulfopyruvate decarboxylase TPP-binding subunit
MPESVPSSLIIDAFKEIFQAERRGGKRQDPLGWIISVPDTHQKSVLAALDKERGLRVLTCSTEDDANAVAAGLYMTGEPVIVMIQHAGLYASVNTIRGISMDGKVPIFYMIGLLSREKDRDPKDSRHSMVRFAEPLLDVFGIPHARLEGPDDVKLIPEYYRKSRERKGPAAVLVGLETA